MLTSFFATLLLASPTGGVFSGPTHINGSSIYWGPAVLGHVPQSGLAMVEVIGYFTHANYQRTPEDPTTEPAYRDVKFTNFSPDLCTTFLFDVPSHELRIYAGSFSPSAGGTRWPKDGPQRYQGTFGNILTYGAIGGLIWSPNSRVSVAAGAGPLYMNVQLENAYDFGAFINSKLTPGADLFALEDPALEGYLKLQMTGWTMMGQLSLDVKPLDNLEIVGNFFLAGNATLRGHADVQGPAALRNALPDLVVNPRGKIVLPYPLPWFVSVEAQLTLGKWQVAELVQFQRRSRQRLLVARVVESESSFIEGDQVSLREVRDEFLFGTRVTRQVSDTVTLAIRGDITPRNTPKEAITPVGLDFTIIESNIGARFVLGDRSAIEVTIGGLYAIPVDVTRSIFNPRADPASGLAQSSPLGHYSAFSGKMMVAYSLSFGN